MKKIVLMTVALLSMSYSNAKENVDKFDMTTNLNSLSKYLKLTPAQAEDLKDVHDIFCMQMELAGKADEEQRQEKIDIAVRRNLKFMNMFLKKEQYKKYLRVLNATLVNREIIK
ncbi:MAG: hypothetical protein KBS94_04325 [Prevotella sp.]|nr:hypothetical protein [Candidatus Equicola faecalis]MDO4819260.1 hypothetical protein [Prevotella sp.]